MKAITLDRVPHLGAARVRGACLGSATGKCVVQIVQITTDCRDVIFAQPETSVALPAPDLRLEAPQSVASFFSRQCTSVEWQLTQYVE